MNLKLIHVPGETQDQIAIWMPEKKALFCADDFYRAFPNLYAIRGTEFRDLMSWVQSVDKMRYLRPDYLIPSHTEPLVGSQVIFDVLTAYRDAILFVHDQTLRYINRDTPPDEIVELVRLPTSLANNPYLQVSMINSKHIYLQVIILKFQTQ